MPKIEYKSLPLAKQASPNKKVIDDKSIKYKFMLKNSFVIFDKKKAEITIKIKHKQWKDISEFKPINLSRAKSGYVRKTNLIVKALIFVKKYIGSSLFLNSFT